VNGPVVTVTATIMDGTVARWYRTETELAWGNETISASRNGVHGHSGHITPELFDAAWTAHLALKNGADIGHLATHRRRGLTGPYERLDAYSPTTPMGAASGMGKQ
jgi:hypothetical protein